MKTIFLTILLSGSIYASAFAQDTAKPKDSTKSATPAATTSPVTTSPAPAATETKDTPLLISGSIDTYYKYDLSGYINKIDGQSNIRTSFANEQNSVSIGMLDLSLKKTVGKTSFVGELGFGPRGQYQSIPDVRPQVGSGSFHIQNLYVNYNLTDKLALTAGFMQTFIGYEVIAPTGNFNYSTSHLFTNGPFENAGIKGTYSFSSKASLMVGLFNDWNQYQDFNGVSDIGAQLFLAPAKGWTAYLNFITGKPSGTEYDLTTSYQVTEKFKVGLNAADYAAPTTNLGGFDGGALYLQYALNPAFSLGVRGEYFKPKDTKDSLGVTFKSPSTVSGTLSANWKVGALTIIPEFRFDGDSQISYFKKNTSAFPDTKQASQFLIAAVYAF